MTPTTRSTTSGLSPDDAVRILVVEDEPHVRILISRRLQQAGFTVETASTGEEAVALAEGTGEPFHFVVTDGIMPGMDGFELARYFARAQPSVAVVLISGFLGHFVNRPDIPKNVGAFFPKPFSGEDLVAHILERCGAPA